MKPFKTLALTIAMLALLAANSAAQSNAYNFYFLPPNTREWIGAIPYIGTGGGALGNMEVESNICGWYKMRYFNEEPPSGIAAIGQGPNLKSAIPINNLAGKFDELNSDNIYFNAENDTWSANAPLTINTARCQYTMAAIIFDTDMSVHPDFSCGEYAQGTNAGNGANTKATCTLGAPYSSVPAYTSGGNLKGSCTGVRRGVVKPTLNTETRKIEYNASGDKWGCWTSEDWFNKAFNPTPGTNVVRCYDMPFERVANGRYEFDSDKLLNANGQIVGGFFPVELTHREDADYSQCPNCDAKRPAENFVPLISYISADVFDSYTPQNGEFSDGNNPLRGTVLPGVAGSPTGSVWNWANPNEGNPTWQSMNWYLHGNSAIKGAEMAPANQFFCFESHAEFTYDPAHEFFFRGDDDIWIYINNQLVVDLGGTHLAAPGHVKLKNITPALVEGEKYPIDIFFCDRRTTMSNVLIKSNIYFWQTTADGGAAGLYLQEGQSGGKTLCLREAANTCAALTGSISAEPICGEALAPRISYHLEVPGLTNVYLSTANNNCEWTSETQGTCYNNGIILDNGTVTVNNANMPQALKELGFELYATVQGYGPLNMYKTETTPIITRAPVILSNQEPKYYTLKGEPLGSKKPSKAGVYIVRQGGVNKMAVVRN